MAWMLETDYSLPAARFVDLFEVLNIQGYTIVGPQVRDGAIVYAELERPEQLPIGVTDRQAAGTYRLETNDSGSYFGYNVGPHSWKRYIDPPRRKLWSIREHDGKLKVEVPEPQVPKLALLGVRSCELHALALQDKVFLAPGTVDPSYKTRREVALYIAVNCTVAGGTCLCTSMQTGPEATVGYDLCLTEIADRNRHLFLIKAGSQRGLAVIEALNPEAASEKAQQAGAQAIDQARRSMGRSMNTEGLQELLYGNREHPHWDEVASRCQSCANCTMVCPTCFCSTVEDLNDLGDGHAERWKRWDSCFNLDFSYLHGGEARAGVAQRYRHWITHKLASWVDQFDSLGCVGCGRCITWCPVGIDITEEVKVLRASTVAGAAAKTETGAEEISNHEDHR